MFYIWWLWWLDWLVPEWRWLSTPFGPPPPKPLTDGIEDTDGRND